MLMSENNFTCLNCKKVVSAGESIGTAHRNHCPFCLWSKHVDDKISGDRAAKCDGEMKPVGLTFKHEGFDKKGNPRQGELMIVHVCGKCGKISINRLAGDDEAEEILKLVGSSFVAPGIDMVTAADEPKVHEQLFGKK